MEATRMKAVTFHEHGGLDRLQCEDVLMPEVGPGEALVRVKACALNHLDIWIRQGIPAYQVPLPHISGCDVAGIVEHMTESIPGVMVGQPVFVAPGLSCWRCERCLAGRDNLCPSFHVLGAQVDGGYAEFVKVPIVNLLPIPQGLTFEQAAAFPLVSLTAWHMLFGLAKLRPGETALVMGAGSGVGSMAVQMANLTGVRVLATVGSEEKCAKAERLGADLVINHTTDDIVKRVQELTEGRGVDVVVEHIGESVWDQCLRVLVRGGRLVTCGATTGGEAKLNVRFLFARQLTLMGSYLGTRAELSEAAALIGTGQLQPVVDRVLPLDEARQAQELLLNRQVFGKVVLSVN